MALLEVRDLKVNYGPIQAIRGIDLDVEEGQIVALLGANGAGKTTTLRAISGVIKHSGGTITLDGKPLGKRASKVARQGISMSPEGRLVFYGAMVAEGIIALVWCAAGVTIYESTAALQAAGGGTSTVVYQVCQSTMGKIGGALALIGVVVCPISSGDTAYRSARLTIADWFKIDQGDWKKRLLLTFPLLAIGAVICHLDYSMVWRYFSWSNQTLAMIALWAASVYLAQNGKNYKICSFPATFMTAVSVTYFCSAPECLGILWSAMGLGMSVYYPIAVVAGIAAAAGLFVFFNKKIKAYQK